MSSKAYGSLLVVILILFVLLCPAVQAATITVDTTSDNADDGCTLREAIDTANSNTDNPLDGCTAGTGGDTIAFEAGLIGIIELEENLSPITEDLTIEGPGAADLVVDGMNAFGIISIDSMTNDQTVTISGLTVRKGLGMDGGGISVSSGDTLELVECDILNNQADGDGGGIFNSNGIVRLTECTIDGNDSDGDGAGIYNDGGAVVLTDCTVNDNESLASTGGILNDGILTLTGCTISNNEDQSAEEVGGILNKGSAVAVMVNTTISTNIGDGISNAAGADSFMLTNCTVCNNTGSGIDNNEALTVTLKNTIVADNAENCSGPAAIESDGNNLDSGDTCDLSLPTDLSDTDPMLGPLGINDGPTRTHALDAGSPAIDAGDDSVNLQTDQRGVARPQDGDGDGTSDSDIGAFEFELTGGIPVDGKDYCLFVTVANGSNMKDELVALRKFRDHVLLKSAIGKVLIRFYYTVSPLVANSIRGHETLRTAMRLTLTPLVYGIKYSKTSTLFFLFALLSVAFLLRKRRLKEI